MAKKWKMEAPCADCPFSQSAAGKRLARSLRPGRIAEIKAGLRRGDTFMCHKTTQETGNGTNLLCAGSLEYQHGRGVISQYERICHRLDALSSAHSSRRETPA